MKIFYFVFTLILYTVSASFSQTVIVGPPNGYYSNSQVASIKQFFNPGDMVVLSWNHPLINSNVKLKIGTSPGNYGFASTDVTGSGKSFIPGNSPLNLSTGRYYCIITNSSENSLSGIRGQYQGNPGAIEYSNEFQFVVQATVAPYAVAPRGNITDATPIFQWNPVPGVPAYWIIVSSTPFVVGTDNNGQVSVQGANIVWDYITTGTSATYGQISPYSPFTQTALPIFPNVNYNYTILNLYDPTNISFASTVFGGAVLFSLQNSNNLIPPNLISPADNIVFSAVASIHFQWDPVVTANTYSFNLFNRVTQFGGNNQEIDIPVWNTSTTNTQIDFPAVTKLSKGKYVWFVVPNTSSGSGTVSASRIFQYVVPTGKYKAQCFSADDNSTLMNFQFQINSTTGRYSPSVPIIVSNSSSYSDSLPADSYVFTAHKPGYNDSTFSVQIIENGSNVINLMLRAYPVTISGSVKDQVGNSISGANLNFVNIFNGNNYSATTISSGNYSVNLPKGNYSLTAAKPGYLTCPPVSVSADSGQVMINPIVITYDNAVVSGKVINDNNEPVQLANLSAVKGITTQQTATDASGNYSFNLSSGQWTVDVAKNGFISPISKNLNLAPGDNLQNQNLLLVPRANQVTGYVYKLITTSQAQTTSVPFSGVIITATPTSGPPVTAVSNSSGQYTLSLKNGSWTITCSQNGYSSGNPFQLTLTIAQTLSGIDFTLTPNPSLVSGLITDLNGTPLGNAAISVQNLGTTLSLSSGNYSLSLPSGTFSITVSKSGYVSPQPLTVNLNPGQNLSGINFQLSPNAGIISGKVTSSGLSLSNASVNAVNGTLNSNVKTDINGNYTLNLQPGQWNLQISKQGFISSQIVPITIGGGQTSSNNNFNLIENTAIISGIVMSGTALINNALVQISEVNNNSNSMTSVTDINGTFSVTMEAGKNYTIFISKDGYASQTKTTGITNPLSTLNYNFTIIPNPSSLSGKVFSNIQVPIAHANVYLINNQTGQTIDSCFTDNNGLYSIGVSSGMYKLSAQKPGYTKDDISLQINIGQNLTNINFTLNENFALITGTVTDNSGNVIQGALINLAGQVYGATTTTNQAGVYILSQLPGNVYNIDITKTGYSDSLISNYIIHDGENKTINAALNKFSGKITGKLSDSSGVPIPQASVNTRNQNNQSFSAVTDNNGNYEIGSLAPGAYLVTANKTGYTSLQQIAVTISPQNLSVSANITDFLQNKGKLSGIVRDNLNSPLLDANINISGLTGSAGAVTSTDGKFLITNLAKGKYNLVCTKTNYSEFDTVIVVTDSLLLQAVLNINSSTIKGNVKNQENKPLPFVVPLTAVSLQKNVYQTTTDLNGYFEFTNVASNSTYTISTQIFKEGVINDTISNIIIPSGQSIEGPFNITVNVNNSQIKGNTGTPSALMKLTNLTTNEIKNVTTSSNGTYQFGFLENGSYRISPGKSGYLFSPSSKDLIVGLSDTINADFQSSSNVGNILITAAYNSGSPVSGVNITMINYSINSVFTGTTDNSGACQVNDLEAGNYVIKLSKTGYAASPDSAVLNVTNGITVSKSFIITRNSGSASGIVYQFVNASQSPSPDVNITLRNLTTGETFSCNSSPDGTYKFDNLSSGDMEVKSSKSGFISDSVMFHLSGGEIKLKLDLTIKASFVQLTGNVVYNNSGLQNIQVDAVSSSVLTVQTNSNGEFTFNNALIKPGPNDTTIYQVKISGSDISTQIKMLRIPGTATGGIITIPSFILPSGQISLTFSDMVNPVADLKITFSYPDGQSLETITGTTGKFISGNKLGSGTYKFSLSKKDLLVPNDSSLTVILESDTTKINKTIALPYIHSALTDISPAKSNPVKVYFYRKPVNTTSILWYKQKSSTSFTQSAMLITDSCFYGEIPPLYSLEDISYYIQITDIQNRIIYNTSTITVTPSAEGILSTMVVTPQLTNVVLRKGDNVDINLTIRDGKNHSLSEFFIGQTPLGHLLWQLSDPTSGKIIYLKSTDSSQVRLVMNTEGVFKLLITASLQGISLTTMTDITVGNPKLQQISVNSPVTLLNNKSSGIQCAYTATDTLKRSIFLGNSVNWSVSPAESGTLTQTGLFTPVDSNYIGIVTITAKDEVTGFSGSTEVSVYVLINPASSLTLTDRAGMNLTIQPGSVNGNVIIKLSKPQFGPGKKTFAPLGQKGTFVVSDKQYQIVYDADLGLPGDSLMKAANLEIYTDNSLRFFEGEKSIANYDYKESQWFLNPTSPGTSNSFITNSMYHFGEYAILSVNEPLGLKYVSLLPSPFSPQVAPLKIGYFLSTLSPPALVTIKIYTVRGELVRTLLNSSQQDAGIYGGRKGKSQIEWDGKTDNGLIANNGRYIIQITAKDVTGEVTEIKQVVLVK